MFEDRVKIHIVSGRGGDGHVSFRRESYVPAGGPDGGDGGKGGDVIFQIDNGLNTLGDFRRNHTYKAQDGKPGSKKNCHGADGEDIILKVPEGTVVMEAESQKIIADMSGDHKRQVVLSGGRGGKGNRNYATPSMQAPRYAQPGQLAQELDVILELKLIADVGLLGFPNVGKSTLLTRVSNARPEIANYHFTTLNPHLGVVDYQGINDFVIADIPGLIEGASDGVGLGYTFLRHIERTRMMIHIVDGASVEGRDPIEDIYKINRELEAYNPEIARRPQVIAANKMDALSLEDREMILQILKEEFEPETPVFAISAVSGEGIRELFIYVKSYLMEHPLETVTFEQEYFPDEMLIRENLPFTVEQDPSDSRTFVVEGPKIEKMLGYTNLDSEKGFAFFQNFLKTQGILDALTEAGVQEGDTIRMYGLSFDYYP